MTESQKKEKLTLKQKKFVDEYIQSGNATASYRIAYPNIKSDATAQSNSSRLLLNAKVRNYLKERQEEISNSRIAPMQEVQEFWSSILRNKEEKTADRLKASEFIARTNGAFLDKVHFNGNTTVEILDNIPSGDEDD